jgi:hypothetical protein
MYNYEGFEVFTAVIPKIYYPSKLALCLMMVILLDYYSTLKMDGTYSSQILFDFNELHSVKFRK